jgi:predicted dehydrogenase
MTHPRPLRGAIIGCGDICRAHFTAYSACGIELAAVCDLDGELARRKAREHGHPEAPIYTDHRELLARGDVDFVTVATPVSAHAPLTIAALAAGKHVACEKPSALTLEENLAILQASTAARKRVMFFSSRNRYGYAKLAERHCRRGDLGRIYRVDVQLARRRGRPGVDIIQHATWFIDRCKAGGGVIMDMGQYFMDEVFNLTGWPEIVSVSAASFRGMAHALPPGTTYDVEEQCTILARAADGCCYTFDLSWIGHQKPRMEISLRGTTGGVRIDHEDKERPFTFFADGDEPWHWMNTTTDWRDNRNGTEHAYDDFARAIRGETVDYGTTPEQAVAITRFTLMALRSAELGREVKADEIPLPAAAKAR